MSYIFQIIDHKLTFSQEKVDYIRMKGEFTKLCDSAKDEFKELLPDIADDNGGVLSIVGDAVLTTVGNGFLGLTAWGGLATSFLSEGNYGQFNIFLEERNQYVVKYIEIIKRIATDIANDLQEHRVYIDENELIIRVLSDSQLPSKLSKAGDDIQLKSGENRRSEINRFYNYYMDEEKRERFDMKNSTAEKSAIYDAIVGPLNMCFLKIVGSSYGDKFYNDDVNDQGNMIHIAQKCSKKVFQRSEIQNAMLNELWSDVFRFFRIKRMLYEENGLGSYEIITSDEADRAAHLYNLYTSKTIIEEDEKKMMAEALVCNPSSARYYLSILDKYYDPDGELQKLADLMGIDILSRIEGKLMKYYTDGDTGTLESTLAVKENILSEQKKYALDNSEALKAVTTRQYFIELMDKAAEMDLDTVIAHWQSIGDGSNAFVEDRGGFISDEQCIDILSRRFRKIHAAEYHDIIRDLGLTDDTSAGDKNYGFYEEGENYILFEDICKKATGFDIPRDADLTVQNYSEEAFASAEIMLGYFHYTRQLDVIGDGISMIITNKRIYTTKEKFTDFSCISLCKPVKKLMLNYLVFEMMDGSSPIQLPVNKDIILPAADMINRLIAALDGREKIEFSEIERTKTAAAINEGVYAASKQISDKFGMAKKGLKSLFRK